MFRVNRLPVICPPVPQKRSSNCPTATKIVTLSSCTCWQNSPSLSLAWRMGWINLPFFWPGGWQHFSSMLEIEDSVTVTVASICSYVALWQKVFWNFYRKWQKKKKKNASLMMWRCKINRPRILRFQFCLFVMHQVLKYVAKPSVSALQAWFNSAFQPFLGLESMLYGHNSIVSLDLWPLFTANRMEPLLGVHPLPASETLQRGGVLGSKV